VVRFVINLRNNCEGRVTEIVGVVVTVQTIRVIRKALGSNPIWDSETQCFRVFTMRCQEIVEISLYLGHNCFLQIIFSIYFSIEYHI
jgi:hypothetical protein